MKRRILSTLTALALCLSLCPTWALAEEADPTLCKHHPEHTEDCGYAAPTEGQPCTHEHTDECYTEETLCVHVHDGSCYSDGILPGEEETEADNCAHECTTDSGCVTRTLNCQHSHDSKCGYVEADPGQPCGFVCRVCPIEALIAALPEKVTGDNRVDVEAQLQEILGLYADLTEEEAELVDISPCLELFEALDEANSAMPLAGTFQMNDNITINNSNKDDYNGKTLTGTSSEHTLTIDGVEINLTLSNLNFTGGTRGTIVLDHNAKLNLTLSGSNTLTGGGSTAGITVPEGCSLTINGTNADSLTVSGGSGGAGIGANYYAGSSGSGEPNTVGTITINGGNITAKGFGGGAGIGGTTGCRTGHVVINGGNITAEAIYAAKYVGAAGIGGGIGGYLESIEIHDGTVTATGSGGVGAGIGAGYYNKANIDNFISCGNIQINGGTVQDTVIGFTSDEIANDRNGGSVTIGENANLPGCTVRPLPEGYTNCSLSVTIYDESITADTSVSLTYGGASWTGTLKKSADEPYCGTFTTNSLLVKGTSQATVALTVTANGKTWTQEVTPQENCSVTIGSQAYERYNLTGTIYDGRITGDMQATVTFLNESHTVTLKKTSDYCAMFSIRNLTTAVEDVANGLTVKVTADGISWSGTASGSKDKTLTIGQRLSKTRLNFWDKNITDNLSVDQIQVTRNGHVLDSSEMASDNTLHMEQAGKGYMDVWMVPGENTTISVTVPDLNGGLAIEKSGLTIESKDMTLEWYRGVSSDTPKLDISKGSITFSEKNGTLSVTYTDGTGAECTQSNLNYDALHVITQSNPETPAANGIVVRDITQPLHLQIENINLLCEAGSLVSIASNCNVELQTKGENTVKNSSANAAVSVAETATLTLSGTGTLTVENSRPRGGDNVGAAIGGDKLQNSGKIIIVSGTVNATANGYGASIGGGRGGTGTVEISGGTVTANATSEAAIGGGSGGAGTVEISGGTVTATVTGTGAAIGGGNNGTGTVTISGGTVTANATYGAAIGGGDSGTGTVEISGGTVTATAKDGAAIGGGDSGTGTVEISGGTVTATTNGMGAAIGGGSGGTGEVTISGGQVEATAYYPGAAIGGGSEGAGTVEISGGQVTATARNGAAIGGGLREAGTVTISGGTVTASSTVGNGGDEVGNGMNASGGSVTITGGSIKATNQKVTAPQNGSSEGVDRVEITLDGARNDILVTGVSGITNYGLQDVYTRDNGKLYFYLPNGTRPTSITAGGVDYVPDSEGSTKYVVDFRVELKGYPLTKVYDGKAMAEPAANQVESNATDLTFAWYQGETPVSAPMNVGSYTLRVSSDKGIKDFAVTISQRPLTITAENQAIDYKETISQTAYKASGLAAGDTVGSVVLTASQNTPGTYIGAITVSSAQIMRGDADVTGNYDITYQPGDLTINQIATTVSDWPTAAEITYGQSLRDSALTGGSASTAGSFGWEDSSIIPAKTGTPSYTVVFTPADTNYGTVSKDIPVTVNQAPLTITAEAQTITYGEAIKTAGDRLVTVSGLVNGDKLTAFQLSAANADAGTYPTGITVEGAEIKHDGTDVTQNYKITYVNGKLTITKDASAKPPAAGAGYTLDYAGETITVKKGYEVSTADDETGTPVTGGSITAHLGQTLYIRKVEDNNHAASGWTAIQIAARPAAPELTVQNETLKGKSDGQLTGDGTGTEYSADGGATWTEYTDGAFSGLAGGTALQVRVKATEGKPHGEAGSYTIAEGKTITVTFDSQGGSAVSDLTGLIYEAVITPPEPPTRTDYAFLGWYTDQAGTTKWDFDTKLTTETVTLYAKWKQVNFTVGGTVKNDANSPVSGATVKLMQGSKVIDQGETSETGVFTFRQHIPAGAYNIVTTYTPEGKAQQTKTTLITLSDSDMTGVAVTLPPEGVNSELAVKPNTPAVVVGGLDEEAADLKTENASASTVTVSMTVEGKQEAAVPAEQVSAIKDVAKQSGTSDPVVEYLDVSITKQVDDTKESVTSTKNVIEIVVPFDFSGKDADKINVLRYHGSSAASLEKLGGKPTSGYTDGKVYPDTANGFLYIYATQFSTYAVAYEVTRYTVTFDAGSGTVSPASSKTTSAGTLSTLPTPTRSGYSFTGWYTSGGTKVTTSTVFKEDTTIYARWQQDAPPPPPVDPTVPVRGISLNKTSLTLTVGQTERLIAAIQPSNATNKSVVWSTSDPSVAAVDSNGNVTARTSGTAVITVRTVSGGYRATCTVTVRASEPGHVHEWSADWTTDATHHWHECLAEGCGITADSEKDGYGVHVYDNKQDTDCNVCGHIRTVAPPDPDHVHRWDSAWSGDSAHHWHECLVEGCDITADSGKDGYGWHIPGAWTTDYPATSTMAGRRYRACTVCGRILETASIPATGGSSGGGGSSVRTYAITVEKPEHGKVTASRTYASSGTTITLTATADAGYVLLDLTVTDSQGNVVALTDQNTFTMPGRAVTVKASFAPLPDENQEKPCDGGADCPSGAYADLDTGTWYHEAVDYAIRKGLLTGYGNGTFNPNGNLSRAQLAQILYNMEGRPSINGGSSFVDVAPDSWYADAVTWAAAQGIVGGYGNGRFGPNDSITREQLAVMLWRYNKEPAATDKELHFSDAHRASSWALDALRWAAENGILNGKGNGILDPAGLTSRAEAAQMFENLLNK